MAPGIIYLVVEWDESTLIPLMVESEFAGSIYTVISVHLSKEAALRGVHRRLWTGDWDYDEEKEEWTSGHLSVAIREFQIE